MLDRLGGTRSRHPSLRFGLALASLIEQPWQRGGPVRHEAAETTERVDAHIWKYLQPNENVVGPSV